MAGCPAGIFSKGQCCCFVYSLFLPAALSLLSLRLLYQDYNKNEVLKIRRKRLIFLMLLPQEAINGAVRIANAEERGRKGLKGAGGEGGNRALRKEEELNR